MLKKWWYHWDKDPNSGYKYTDCHVKNPTGQVRTTSGPFPAHSMSVRDKFDRQTRLKSL